jgi:probable phosphoglycerate mutase
VEAHSNGRVAVISHKATIRLLISSLLGFDPRGYRDRLDQSPACLNVLDFKDPSRARLTLLNDTSHYSPTDSSIPEIPIRRLSKWWDEKR